MVHGKSIKEKHKQRTSLILLEDRWKYTKIRFQTRFRQEDGEQATSSFWAHSCIRLHFQPLKSFVIISIILLVSRKIHNFVFIRLLTLHQTVNECAPLQRASPKKQLSENLYWIFYGCVWDGFLKHACVSNAVELFFAKFKLWIFHLNAHHIYLIQISSHYHVIQFMLYEFNYNFPRQME